MIHANSFPATFTFDEGRLMVGSIVSAVRARAPKAVSFGFAAAALMLGLLSGTPAMSQDSRIESLVNRLDRMERDMGSLSRQVYSGGAPKGGAAPAGGGPAPSGDYMTRLEDRLNQLEGQLTQMTGTVETLMHSNTELTAQIERMSKDYDSRFKDMEGRGGTPSSAGTASFSAPQPDSSTRGAAPANLGTLNQRDIQAAPKGAAPPAPQQRASLPAGSPQQQYDYAYSLLNKARTDADYTQAAQAFRDFLAKNSTGPLASAARYWMGRSYVALKDHDSAARAFLEGYQGDRKGQKAPETLLELGASLTSIGKNKEACATLDALTKEFPAAAKNLSRLPAERKRAGCA